MEEFKSWFQTKTKLNDPNKNKIYFYSHVIHKNITFENNSSKSMKMEGTEKNSNYENSPPTIRRCDMCIFYAIPMKCTNSISFRGQPVVIDITVKQTQQPFSV